MLINYKICRLNLFKQISSFTYLQIFINFVSEISKIGKAKSRLSA